MFNVPKINGCDSSFSIKRIVIAAISLPMNVIASLITYKAYHHSSSLNERWIVDASNALGKEGSTALLVGTVVSTCILFSIRHNRAQRHVQVQPEEENSPTPIIEIEPMGHTIYCDSDDSEDEENYSIPRLKEDLIRYEELIYSDYELPHEEREHLGVFQTVIMEPTPGYYPFPLRLRILPVQFNLQKAWNFSKNFTCYGFTTFDNMEIGREMPAWRMFQNQYLFFSLTEINVIHPFVYSDLEIYCDGVDIAKGLLKEERQAILTRMTPKSRATNAPRAHFCFDFFNEVFSQDLPRGKTADLSGWNCYALEENEAPRGASAMIFYNTNRMVTHWAVQLDPPANPLHFPALTLSEIGNTGLVVFATIHSLKQLYSKNAAFLLPKNS